MNALTPKYVQANGLHNPFTGNKKWTITCGKCEHTWKEKVPVNEKCSAVCPSCSTQNIWSLSAFVDNYEKEFK